MCVVFPHNNKRNNVLGHIITAVVARMRQAAVYPVPRSVPSARSVHLLCGCCAPRTDPPASRHEAPKLPPRPLKLKPLVANLLDVNFFAPGNGISHLYRQHNTDVLRFTILGIDSCYLRNPEHFEQALVDMPYATFDKTDFRPIAEWLGVCLSIHWACTQMKACHQERP